MSSKASSSYLQNPSDERAKYDGDIDPNMDLIKIVDATSGESTGVLNWFAKIWEIEQDEYWGYVTTCGTEGNLHGIYVGRENLPDGILYASQDSHYSVFKAGRMYRMDTVKVGLC